MRWRLWMCLLCALGSAANAAAQGGPAPAAGKPEAKPAEAKTAAPAQPESATAAPAPSTPAEAAGTGAAEPAAEGEPAPTTAGTPPEAAGEKPASPAPAVLPSPGSEVPSPGEMENLLSQQLAGSSQPSRDWTAPAPVLTLHGYMRVRGELMDTFWVGRRPLADYVADASPTISPSFKIGQGPDPFTRFRPLERRTNTVDCVSDSRKSDGTCSVGTLRFANMRLRLAPQLNVSEDVRVKMLFDVFDNLVLGNPPQGFYGSSTDPQGNPNGAQTVLGSGTTTPDGSPQLGSSIKARYAWAEVRNRDLGELRFGRMPQHWGLGMYYNSGSRLDDDRSTDMDRVVGTTKLAGLYLSAAFDFVGGGVLDTGSDDRPIEQSRLVDVHQYTFSVARRNSDEELSSAKDRGDMVVNGGVQFSVREQDSLYGARAVPAGGTPVMPMPLRVNAGTRTTDAWGLLRYRGLRLEGEFAWVNGSMDDVATGKGSYRINQLGYALESEVRLLGEKLGIYFDHGLATGDSDVEGLSSDSDFITQLNTNRTVSTFRFHPSYRVDLILWRNIMQQVTGAYYFKPGISYDFVKSAFGQLAGARLDFIWSRASSYQQTWGNASNLGIELDASLYFRSEDGPDLDDGFHAMLQYGVLFPMRGLSYLHEHTDLATAQTLRLLLGVVF
ncbi:MAG: TIGR04551 family protein [Polyangiales bacterium]